MIEIIPFHEQIENGGNSGVNLKTHGCFNNVVLFD